MDHTGFDAANTPFGSWRHSFWGGVTLTWRANSEAYLNGYRVYFGTSSRFYGISTQVDKDTTYTMAGLEQGKTYYFAVTAQDISGNESGYSSDDWFLNGNFLNSASNSTDDSGKADCLSKKVRPRSGETFTFVVTDVSKDGMLFEPADSPRTAVSVSVP